MMNQMNQILARKKKPRAIDNCLRKAHHKPEDLDDDVCTHETPENNYGKNTKEPMEQDEENDADDDNESGDIDEEEHDDKGVAQEQDEDVKAAKEVIDKLVKTIRGNCWQGDC